MHFSILRCLSLLLLPLAITAQPDPEIVAPGIISNGGEFGFTLSPDASHALWVRSNGKRDTLIILESFKVNGRWQTPVVASFSGGNGYPWKDIDPMFSPDGKMVLFQSDRPVPGQTQRQGFDIWAVLKTTTGWSKAFHLGNRINTDSSESYASMSSNGNIYFMKPDDAGKGLSDIYLSKKADGKYLSPVNIGLPVNTGFRESNPFISADEDFLIYFSTDTTGLGQADLYISYQTNGQWSPPVNMGIPVNSAMAEFCPFYHAKEKKLYYSRQQRNGDRFIENIYSLDFDPYSKR